MGLGYYKLSYSVSSEQRSKITRALEPFSAPQSQELEEWGPGTCIFTTSSGDLEAALSLGAILVYSTLLLKLRSKVSPFGTVSLAVLQRNLHVPSLSVKVPAGNRRHSQIMII